MIKILPSSEAGKILQRRQTRLTEAEATVAPILEAVRKRGDKGRSRICPQVRRLQSANPLAVPESGPGSGSLRA